MPQACEVRGMLGGGTAQLGQIAKTRQKCMKLASYTSACIGFTIFEYAVHAKVWIL